jgi:hypothetical protein
MDDRVCAVLSAVRLSRLLIDRKSLIYLMQEHYEM